MSVVASEWNSEWKKTACILCSLNCGLETQTEDGRIRKVRGDKASPASQGYLCEKAQRLDHYQNGADRIDSPKRRRADGSYEDIDWETAIGEIAARLTDLRARHGGESIFYYGGASQGNHLGSTYADNTLKALGVAYRSNALAQEKTGEGWVQGKMMGCGVHGDFEHCEVAVFVGKNPWHSHGFSRARYLLKQIENDPRRSMIVIDPRRSETAAMADFHLAVRPATDAWCLAALSAILVQEGLVNRAWLSQHTTGAERVLDMFARIDVSRYASICGVGEDLLRRAARRIAAAESVSMIEDLGIQMNRNSTLNSYLNRLVWLLTGNFGKRGANNAFVPLLGLSKSARSGGAASAAPRKSPVTGSKIIMGLIPCNVIPDEILTDHPKRFRAMIVESSNPVHSLASSRRMREAMRALELSVVIDVAMTETARQADYVLPATSQFEKAEATFFNLEFPKNTFHLRRALFAPRAGTLTEAEIHARLLERLGEITAGDYTALREAAKTGLDAFAQAFQESATRDPKILRYASVVLYRTLGEALPEGLAPAASLWGVCQNFVRNQPVAAAKAGFGGDPVEAGNRLFSAIVNGTSGVVFAVSDYEDSWRAVRLPEGKINLVIEELLPELVQLENPGAAPRVDPEFPFALSAGERRSVTTNTAVRDAGWHHKGAFGTLRMNPADAARLQCATGDLVRLTTRSGAAETAVEVSAELQPGHVSLPNGHGLDYQRPDGTMERRGVSVNELTGTDDRDAIAGTPWHKYVPAKIERLA